MEKELIKKLVQAMEIEKGEVVLLNFWGEEKDLDDLYEIAGEIAAIGAMPMPLVHSGRYYAAIFNQLSSDIPEKWTKQFDVVDAVIDIINQEPGMPPKELSKEKYPVYGAYLQKLFGAFSTKKKMIQLTMPTEENAKYAGIEFEQYKERMIKALDIDYPALKEECQNKIEAFSENIRTVKSGENCILTIDTEGRNWIADAGDGALPCGEIYIAPVEENTNGKIFFEILSLEDGRIFNNVTVVIENGHIVSSDCEEFDAFIKELPEGGDIVAELGIGMNPNVDQVLGDSRLDENAVGTFHIGIGMNHLFGGKNNCPVHMDFVARGTVE
ncbi:MAG: aminopeptidase [Clostridiales bacterium]|nr:aminopeptidase [Clostridiales bacterium]